MISCSFDLVSRFFIPTTVGSIRDFASRRIMLKEQYPKIYYYCLCKSSTDSGAHTRQTGDNDKSWTGGNAVIIVINERWLMAVDDDGLI